MTNQQNFILRVLTKLDEDIIDKSTQQRFELLNQQKKKPPRHRGWIFGAAMAACLCLIFSTVMILLMPGETSIRQVPVYEGMTVSTMVPDTRERLNTEASASFASLSAPRPSLASLSQLTSEEATAEDDTDHVTQAPVTENAPPAVSGSETLYYAKPHQDIYITIHVNNPDNFEILSFTLNGKVYSSYMFEDGSDMENLILKYNVGDAEGIVEYTIDAIKYVDGTEIKDALMEGDRTVKVGVYTEKQPHVTVSNELAGINKVTFTVTPTDEMNLMTISGGRVTARLTDGENVLSEKEISFSETVEIIFDGLSADTTYRYEIIAEYDALDGQGFAPHLLYEKEFRTEKFVAFDGISTTQDAVSFNLVWNDKIDGADILALELYQGDTMVRELPVTSMKAADLLSDTEYTLVVSYRNSGAVETVKATFTTQAKAVPQLTVTPGEATHTSVGFDVSLTDPDGVGRVTKIELLHGTDAPVVADDLNARRFDGLLSDNEYTVRVTYVYDLNDGTGEHVANKILQVKTAAKAKPKFTIEALNITKDTANGNLILTNTDSTLIDYNVTLYQGSTLKMTNTDKEIAFDTLSHYTDYSIKITYTYDLSDGLGIRTAIIEKAFRTKPHLDVISCRIVNTSAVSDDETIYMQAALDNPQGGKVTAVVVNGRSYTVTGNSTPDQLYVEIVNDGQFAGGNTFLTIEKIYMTLDDTEYKMTTESVHTANVFINGKLEILSIECVNAQLEPVEWYMAHEESYLMLTLSNPTGYSIDSVTLNRNEIVNGTHTSFTFDEWIKHDDSHYYIRTDFFHETTTVIVSVESIQYSNAYLSKSLSCSQSITTTALRLYDAEIHYVSTPEDLLNMDDFYYYELTNDIDLAGLEWHGGDFYGVFEGNGYSIKNMSLVTTLKNSSQSIGLFSRGAGIIQNLHMENITVIADLVTDGTNQCDLFYGALIGGGHLTGDVFLDFLPLILRNCSVDADSTVSLSNQVGAIEAGGLVGKASGTSLMIENCVNHSQINVNSTNHNCRVSGIISGFDLMSNLSPIIRSCMNAGDLTAVGYEADINGIYGVGAILTMTDCINVGTLRAKATSPSAYTDYIFSVADGNHHPLNNCYTLTKHQRDKEWVLLCTTAKLNTKSFWTNTLGWDEAIWNFDDLDFENGKYPTLRR